MKRELDPFESKLKEKLQGKASFPEDILWKRLNDELLRSDKQVASKNRSWILGSALLVFISLGTGYFIGVRQETSRHIATNSVHSGTKHTVGKNSVLPSNQGIQKAALPQVETLSIIEAKQLNGNTLVHDNDLNRTFSTVQNQDILSTIIRTQLNPEDISAAFPKELVIDQSLTQLSKETQPQMNHLEDEFTLVKLALRNTPLLLTSKAALATGSPYKKYFPMLLSASLGFEPTSINRVQTDRTYGTGTTYASNEKGLTTMNVRFGFQAQLGRHLELGIGLGTSAYLTQQTLQNQVVEIDPLAENLNFESSISSFQIHENHLQDDPEDQEENELNFQDSTSFHLNYQISNSIKSIQVPITAGFVFNWNNWKLTMKTGLIYNHITQANQVLNINGFKAIRNDVASQLVSNSYFHLIQLGAEYPVSEHFTILLAPKYSYALKSISKSTVLRPNALGLECALKFYF